MNNVINLLPNTEVYIDDIVFFNDTWDEHMENIRALFDRLTELTINLAKSQSVKAKVTFLGHVIG